MSEPQAERLTGWGKYPSIPTFPRYEARKGHKHIVRGLGRSYGDQAMAPDGDTVFNTQHNRILSLDLEKNVIEVESGISLAEILEVIAPKKRFLSVCPGTKFVTVGGAIANNVHGKSHHVDGEFIDHVLSFELLSPTGKTYSCSREQNTELFYASAGGCGLLGHIVSAQIRLKSISSTYFDSKAFKAKNFDEMLELLDTEGVQYDHSVGWIDTTTAKTSGVLVCGNESKTIEATDLGKNLNGEKGLSVPDIVPGIALNKLSIKVLNQVIGYQQRRKNGPVHYEPFFFPLDGILNWNNGYGKKGFLQFQFVLPIEHGHKNLKTILGWIGQSGCTPFLNVIKRFGLSKARYLSFPIEGYTLALDFPTSRKSILLCKQLSGEIARMGGRVYLAKDAILEESDFKQMYPNLRDWLRIREELDPNKELMSAQALRLGL